MWLRLTSILIRLTIKVRHGTYIEVPYVVIMSLSERIDIDTNSTNEQARTPRFRMVIMSLLNRVIGGVVPLRLYTGTANRIIAFPFVLLHRRGVDDPVSLRRPSRAVLSRGTILR